MKYEIEITPTQQTIIDALGKLLENDFSYSFSPKKDGSIGYVYAQLQFQYLREATVDFYLDTNQLWLSTYVQDAADERIPEFKSKIASIVAVATALDPSIKIVIKEVDEDGEFVALRDDRNKVVA